MRFCSDYVTGSAASYQNWAPGQNTNQQLNVEDCAVMDTRSGGKWNDYQCVDTLFVLHEYPFICEYRSAATYFNWAPQQNTPLQHNVQDCVVMDTTAGGKWKDYQCADALFVKHEHS
ncbi:hypothetical protein BaRGS_00026250, partial [Batillaria attramentaria]